MDKHEYKQFSELKKKMRLVVCTHNKLAKNDFSTDALAYVKRDGKANACYKVYTSEFCGGHSFGCGQRTCGYDQSADHPHDDR